MTEKISQDDLPADWKMNTDGCTGAIGLDGIEWCEDDLRYLNEDAERMSILDKAYNLPLVNGKPDFR